MIHVTLDTLQQHRAAAVPLTTGPCRLRGKRGNHPAVRSYARDTALVPVVDADYRVIGFIRPDQFDEQLMQPIRFDGSQPVHAELDDECHAVQMLEED
jgi:hypothetical protein